MGSDIPTACDRVFATQELLEQIIESMPPHVLLRARQVSRLFNTSIEHSRALRNLRTQPYVAIYLETPTKKCPRSPHHSELNVDLVLYFDKPVTVRNDPWALASGVVDFVFHFEKGTRPAPRPATTPTMYMQDTSAGSRVNLCRKHAQEWITLFPGVPHRMTSSFTPKGGGNPWDGNVCVMRVRLGLKVEGYVGTKERLLARSEAGEDLSECATERWLPIVRQNDAEYEVEDLFREPYCGLWGGMFDPH